MAMPHGGRGPTVFGWNAGDSRMSDFRTTQTSQSQSERNQRQLQGDQLGAQAARQREALDQDRYRTQLNYNASILPEQNRQNRFNTILGLLGDGIGGSTFDRVGGSPQPLPQITAGPVWTQQQINEQVNAGKSSNEQSAQTQMQGQQRQMSGRGFGSNSPLLAALQQQTQTQTNAANSDLERSIRFDTASENAQQLLRGQQAQQNQWKDFEDQDIRRRQLQESSRSQLLNALAAFV